MRNLFELAWEVLPAIRRARVASGALWIQLPISSRAAEMRVTNFMALAGVDSRAKFILRRDAIHENLFCILRVDLAPRCVKCGAKLDADEAHDYDTCENCFYEFID